MISCVLSHLLAAAVVTNVADVALCLDERRSGIRFDLTVTAIGNCDFTGLDHAFAVSDHSGAVVIGRCKGKRSVHLSPGDLLRIHGFVSPGEMRPVPEAIAESIDILGHVPAVKPVSVPVKILGTGAFDSRAVLTQGTVRDAFRDEIDSRVYILILESCGSSIYVTFLSSDDETSACREFINAEVTVSGICRTAVGSSRVLFGRHVHAPDKSHISVVHPAEDSFDVPDLVYRQTTPPQDIVRLGRRRIRGRVTATWQHANVLVKSETGEPVILELSFGRQPPAVGICVEAVGYPTTDLYHVNLTSAVWRPCDELPNTGDNVADVLIADLLRDKAGNAVIRPEFHGKTLRLRGQVSSVPDDGNLSGVLYLEDGGFQIPVDFSSAPSACTGLRVGSTVRVTGTCVVNTEKWQPYTSFPHATGMTLVLRDASGLVLLEAPSWWTRTRVLTAFGLLLAILIAILIWNRILQKLVEQRGHELFNASVDRVSAGLRVEERTRLAAELHDSISQNLASLACQVSAARLTVSASPDAAARILAASENLLQSCRTELRHCLYDLRSDTLELADFDAAIRRTLEPVAKGAKLTVRFAVPRYRLSDTTAHAILCILRELVGNAFRHGKASSVKVAGSLEPTRLLFSVTDDGEGFNPGTAPGLEEGHFGLDGIRSRIHRLNGTFSIESKPGNGARAVVTIPLKTTDHE